MKAATPRFESHEPRNFADLFRVAYSNLRTDGGLERVAISGLRW